MAETHARVEISRKSRIPPAALGAAGGAITSLLLSIIPLTTLTAGHAVLTAAIAAPYLAFAAVGGGIKPILVEGIVVAAFFVAALALVDGPALALAAVLAGHALWDVVHERHNISAHSWWWPSWCAGFDVAAALVLVVASQIF